MGCSPSVDPANTRATPFRVWRGGSWLGASGGVRLANRLGSWPDNSYNILGIRACLAPVIAFLRKWGGFWEWGCNRDAVRE